ncbi:MAG: hypothetical protein IJ774_02710, partial [Selenomonadaceae bacterium]|nr:hypothetical protein [Selenomonadaceae bacterium]
VKPSAADEQRTRDFADKFADKHKFWEALECRCAKWEESTDADINDKRARESLAIAVANGFDPKDAVALFAPTVGGGNICNEINLYTYQQGFGYAKKTPRIKYLLVGQDWGNFINAPAEFKSTVAKMNTGEDIFPEIGSDDTTINLVELFKILKRDVTKPCGDVFFTNFCLGYRLGNESGGMTKKLMRRDADLFRELCEILQPENILCLGRITSECAYEALSGNKFSDICGNDYNDFLDNHESIDLKCGGVLSNFYPLAHCGKLGTMYRSFDRQRADWRRIFDEQLETIFRNALYISGTHGDCGPGTVSFWDANGKVHDVWDNDRRLKKIFAALPDFNDSENADWKYFYAEMGYYFYVNKKVLDSYMRKTTCEIWLDKKAALETIAELKR